MPEGVAPDELQDPVVSIGVLARKVGLSVSAVRKYETEGLVIPHRTSSGHRLFSQEDIHRVRNIHHMVQELGLNFEGIRRLQALMPCWELFRCSAEPREDCPAQRDNSRPCWMARGLPTAQQGNECRGCVVYRFGSLCTQDIKRLLHEPSACRSRCGALRQLMQRNNHTKEEES